VTAWIISAVVSVGLAALVGWAIPAWSIKRLLPVLESAGHLVTNYRGRRIPTGLGLVWLVWAAGVGVLGAAIAGVSYATVGTGSTGGPGGVLDVMMGSPLYILAGFPIALVVGSLAFGLVDDLFGSATAKGFRGHLGALREGRLTTGGLKVLGIGVFAASAATLVRAVYDPLASGPITVAPVLLSFAAWACATLVIALAANLVNLTDLRPGRALKTYSMLSLGGIAALMIAAWPNAGGGAASPWSVPEAAIWTVGAFATCALLLLGPVFAAWRFDLSERAILGDAGANAMGALVGYLLVAVSPLWLIVVLAVILLALNLASERFSFSDVIERVAFLRWIDGLGRLPAEPHGVAGHDSGDGARAGGPAAEGDDARRDGGS
jgi:hypothetical protein